MRRQAVLPVRLAFRMRTTGRADIPRPPFILSGNHASYLDPVLLAVTIWPPVSYMAKVELFEGSRRFAWLLRRLLAFPVARGTADRGAISEASRRLEAGGVVGIFPEGTRGGGEGGEVFGGAAMIALRAGIPIVPVGITGTGDALPRGARRLRLSRVSVVFGEAIRAEDVSGDSRRERVDALTARLMGRIADAVRAAGGE